MKIYSTQKIEIQNKENGNSVTFKDIENNLTSIDNLPDEMIVYSESPVINILTYKSNFVTVTRSDGGMLWFRMTDKGIIISSSIIELVDYSSKKYTTLTLGGAK